MTSLWSVAFFHRLLSGFNLTTALDLRTHSMNAPTGQPKRIVFMAGGYGLCFGVVLWAAYSDRLPLDLLSQIPNYDKLAM